jgi:hypothetical protein
MLIFLLAHCKMIFTVMRTIHLSCILIFHISLYAQSPTILDLGTINSRKTTKDFTIYHNMYDSVQMIRVDNNGLALSSIYANADPLWGQTMSSISPTQRALMMHTYVVSSYIFRDHTGKLLSQYGPSHVTYKKNDFLSVKKSMSISESHGISGGGVFSFINASNFEYQPNYGKFIYMIENQKTEKFGLIDTLGNLLLETEFDKIYYENKHYIVQSDSAWGLLNKSLTPIISPKKYTRLEALDDSSYLACIGNKCGVIDRDENIIVDFDYNDIQANVDRSGITQLYVYKQHNKIGFMDTTFKVLHQAIFTNIKRSSTWYIVYSPDTSSKYRYCQGLLDANGKMVLPCIYHDISPRSSNYIHILKRDDHGRTKMGVSDSDGKIFIPFNYQQIYDFKFGKAIVNDGPYRFSVIDTNGTLLTKFNCSSKRNIKILKNGIVGIPGVGLMVKIFNRDNKLISKGKFTVVESLRLNECVKVMASGEGWGVINQQGNKVISNKYDAINKITENSFLVSKDKVVSIINEQKEIIPIQEEYDRLRINSIGLLAISRNDKWGVLGLEGKMLTKVIYASEAAAIASLSE